MSLSISDAVKNGVSEVVSKTGMTLSVILGTLLTLHVYFYISAIAAYDSEVLMGLFQPYLLIDTVVLNASLALISFLFFCASYVWTCRTVQAGITEFVPLEFLERRIIFAVANLVLGYILFLTLSTIGFMLLIFPALLISGLLFYWLFFVTVEDENFLTAMKSSYLLAKPYWIKSSALVFILMVSLQVFSFVLYIFYIVALFMPTPINWIVGIITTVIFYGAVNVFLLGSLADAYNQMKEK